MLLKLHVFCVDADHYLVTVDACKATVSLWEEHRGIE